MSLICNPALIRAMRALTGQDQATYARNASLSLRTYIEAEKHGGSVKTWDKIATYARSQGIALYPLPCGIAIHCSPGLLGINEGQAIAAAIGQAGQPSGKIARKKSKQTRQ